MRQPQPKLNENKSCSAAALHTYKNKLGLMYIFLLNDYPEIRLKKNFFDSFKQLYLMFVDIKRDFYLKSTIQKVSYFYLKLLVNVFRNTWHLCNQNKIAQQQLQKKMGAKNKQKTEWMSQI